MDKEMQLMYWIVGKTINSPQIRDIKYKGLFKDIDIDKFIGIVKKHKCVPVIYKYLDLFNYEDQEKIKNTYQKFCIRNHHLVEDAIKIADRAKKENLNIVEPKGLALTLTIYQNVDYREFGDIDFIVKPVDLKFLGRVLVEQGFFHRHNGDIADICDKLESNPQSMVYEIKFYKYYNKDSARVIIELKKNTDAVSASVLPYLCKDDEMVYYGGKALYKTFSKEGLLLHLCASIYTDHYSYEGVFSDVGKWRDFIDLYFFCKNVKYDTNKFRELANSCHLMHCVIFCETLMWELFSVSLFEEYDRVCGFSFLFEAVLNNTKKEYFLKRFLIEQQSKDKEFIWQKRFQVRFKQLVFNVERISNDSLKYIIQISSVEQLKRELFDKRLYLFFIWNLGGNITSSITPDSYYEHNMSICLYMYENEIYFVRKKENIFSVNNATVCNMRLNGKNIKVSSIDKNIFEIDIVLPLNSMHEKVYFNALTDLALLNDYYKHDEYLYMPGETLYRIN